MRRRLHEKTRLPLRALAAVSAPKTRYSRLAVKTLLLFLPSATLHKIRLKGTTTAGRLEASSR